ncbi:solute carrier family 28 member 3-like [Apostichopus japonicus]|uniref:solute carrier family 28 member 3-like n=1 Tax=Stichopus japonicus TaxID=307972 RepID=UPI003AB88E7D
MSVEGTYRVTEEKPQERGFKNPGFEDDLANGNPDSFGEAVAVDNKHEVAMEAGDPAHGDSTNTQEQNLQYRAWKRIDVVIDPIKSEVKDNKTYLIWGVLLLLLIIFLIGLVFASVRNLQDATVLLVLTALAVCIAVYTLIRDAFGETIWNKLCLPPINFLNSCGKIFNWIVFLVLLLLAIALVIFLCWDNPQQLTSAAGLVVFIIVTYIFSKYPRYVKWRPVLWGFALQFIFGLFILRTDIGFKAFRWLGDVVQSFLDFSDAGAKFLFGDPSYLDHFFAFKVLPVVIYFSTVISVLYHWGIMQVIIKKIAWLMQKTMQTSASESLNAAGNIFIGQTEAPLMIRPMIKDMTKSELHAVMTGGFATIAGSVLGAYIFFGISASHLLSASVMSAPAALAIAKLFYPETEESKHVDIDNINLPKGDHRNFIEAASHGASTSIPLVLNIAGNLIAFISLLALLNGVLGYIGALLGWDELSFEFICSYVFVPIPFLMGVEPKDCRLVAELIGIKTFLNEFVAYERLAGFIGNRQMGTGQYMSVRSEIIATYALCGFSNVGSIGIQLGGLTPMAPSRAGDLASVALRALIAGSIACFTTACIAGLLYDEANYDASVVSINSTST